MNTAVALLIALTTSLGCSVHAGLSNAPALGTRPGGERQGHDVVANGAESCQRHAPASPLRGHLPPCQSEAPASPVASPRLPEAMQPADYDLVHVRLRTCHVKTRGEPFAIILRQQEWTVECVDDTR